MVEIFAHLLLHRAQRAVQLLDLVVQCEVLFFDEAHLHESCLVSSFECGVGLDQVFKFEDQRAHLDRTLIHVVELDLERGSSVDFEDR